MKKTLMLAGMAAFLFACNDNSGSASVNSDTTNHAAGAPATTTAYTASEGDVSYRNGRLMVWRNGTWTEADKDVELENGVVVRRSGDVERDGKTVRLEDGEVVDKTGRFFDRAGNAIEDAWDATKRGAKKAGEKIESGADKVGEEVKDVFTDDKKEKEKKQ